MNSKLMEKPDTILKFKNAGNRLVLLDYDGTLVTLELSPEKAVPTPSVLRTLHDLISADKTTVFIVTGRKETDIKSLLGILPIRIIAEHGAGEINIMDWKSGVLEQMDEITRQCAGSFVEEKRYTVAWHYRNAPDGVLFSRNLLRQLQQLATKYNLKIIDGNKTMEIMAEGAGKGNAVRKVIAENNYDFVLAIGDDITDEEMFSEVNRHGNAITIKVGSGATSAMQRLASPREVLQLLSELVT